MGMSGLVIAGTHSGVGKTSITLGLLSVFLEMGLNPQPFKIGPDFIDPSLHTLIAGRSSRNLDGWLFSEEAIREIFSRATRDSLIAVVEGVMGLFDGLNGKREQGSTAQIAKILNLPVILIVDAWAMSRSAAAVVLGYKTLDPHVRVAGVILNKVGGEIHQKWLKEAVQSQTGIPVVGFIPFDEALSIPERHLGLIPASENRLPVEFLRTLQKHIRQNFALQKILRIAKTATPVSAPPRIFKERKRKYPARIALPMDRAIHFYYQDNLDLLRHLGAELIFFKPSEAELLPDGIQGIYFGGGFPEIYAKELSGNRAFLNGLKQSASNGMPLYAECGGLMCLTKAIIDFNGVEYPMASVISAKAVMQKRLAAIGYVRVRSSKRNLLASAGTTFRGHVFHNSVLTGRQKLRFAYDVNYNGSLVHDGISTRSLLASYVHVHFSSKPELARSFLKKCHEYKSR